MQVRAADALVGDRDSDVGLLPHIEGILDHAKGGAIVSMTNGICRAPSREVPASDGSICVMSFVVVDVVREVVEGKEATSTSTSRSACKSQAVQTRCSTGTIMHHNFRFSSLALYQLHPTEHALLIHLCIYSTKPVNPR
jgi:hypothetical protein